MGYFGNGFVFTSEPKWPAIAGVLPDFIAMCAYKHKEQSIWFLDAWKHSPRQHWPFAEEFPDRLELIGELPPDTTALLETYQQILKALPSREASYSLGLLRSTANVSLVSSAPTFFFAADDETIDMAVCAEAGRLTVFSVRFGLGTLEFDSSKLTFVPFDYSEDPEFNPTAQDLAALTQIAGLTIAPAKTIQGGLPLYASAVRLWPSGDPAELLGIGTWDPFMDVEDALDAVFERAPSVASGMQSHPESGARVSGLPLSRKKPWWQFWL